MSGAYRRRRFLTVAPTTTRRTRSAAHRVYTERRLPSIGSTCGAKSLIVRHQQVEQPLLRKSGALTQALRGAHPGRPPPRRHPGSSVETSGHAAVRRSHALSIWRCARGGQHELHASALRVAGRIDLERFGSSARRAGVVVQGFHFGGTCRTGPAQQTTRGIRHVVHGRLASLALHGRTSYPGTRRGGCHAAAERASAERLRAGKGASCEHRTHFAVRRFEPAQGSTTRKTSPPVPVVLTASSRRRSRA